DADRVEELGHADEPRIMEHGRRKLRLRFPGHILHRLSPSRPGAPTLRATPSRDADDRLTHERWHARTRAPETRHRLRAGRLTPTPRMCGRDRRSNAGFEIESSFVPAARRQWRGR